MFYLGQMELQKGFEFLEIMIEARVRHPEIAFVAAGLRNEECKNAVRRFGDEGGLVINRYLTDGEFLSAIDMADWVWNCYTPENDQNSGIFGFAHRAGAKAIVRDNSFVARMASEAGVPIVSIKVGDVEGAVNRFAASAR